MSLTLDNKRKKKKQEAIGERRHLHVFKIWTWRVKVKKLLLSDLTPLISPWILICIIYSFYFSLNRVYLLIFKTRKGPIPQVHLPVLIKTLRQLGLKKNSIFVIFVALKHILCPIAAWKIIYTGWYHYITII